MATRSKCKTCEYVICDCRWYNDGMSHAQIREVHLRHKEDWGKSRPCPCQYCKERR